MSKLARSKLASRPGRRPHLEDGATTLEYGIMVALVAAVVIVLVFAVMA